jgi:hypothetical protein
MLFNAVYERFVAGCPISVLAHGLLQRALAPEALDQLFERTAERQYTKKLLFSTTVDVMALVVCRIRPSVHAAYQAKKQEIGVSLRALYDKLECLEPDISAALVRQTAWRLEPIIADLKASRPPLLPGYTVKILDGNHLAKSARRLKVLRNVAAGPLPGQTLVVLEPETQLASAVICCEDGHAQERALLRQIWPAVKERDLWIADRNFCTTGFLFGLAARGAFFIIRQHSQSLRWSRQTPRRRLGRTATGVVYEQQLWLQDDQGGELVVRRVTLVLDRPKRDGETEIHLLTNLPAKVAAKRIATLYRERWGVEHLFQNLTTLLKCEVNTLAYPKAALFAFCVALAASNVLAAVKAALRAAHPKINVDEEVSDYYLADELAGTYRGLLIALPDDDWQFLVELTDAAFVSWLRRVAKQARLERLRKHPRGPKKPPPKRTRFAKHPHVATARLLEQNKRTERHLQRAGRQT